MTAPLSFDGKATTTRTTFSRETSIGINIRADASVIWDLLTDAADMARWNSTIVSLEGNIQEGGSIKLVSKLDEKRTFKLQIKELVPEKRMVWGDKQGQRVYTLEPQEDGSVNFSMSEKIGFFLFPLFGRFIPSFDASFEQFAADLKQEAESRQK